MKMTLESSTTVKAVFLNACRKSDLKEVDSCLSIGANVNWKTEDGYFCSVLLFYAVKWERMKLLNLLLATPGIDVNITNSRGETPLIRACIKGNSAIVSKLGSDPNLDPNLRDIDGWSALDLAIRYNNLACVKVLTEDPRVDLNARDSYGDTPIMYAMKNNNPKIVKILLENLTVDLNLMDSDGKYLENLAREKGMAEIFNPMLVPERRAQRKENPECPVSGKITMDEYSYNIEYTPLLITEIKSFESSVQILQVCLDSFKSEVYQCIKGHFVCASCKPKVKVKHSPSTYLYN